MSVRIKNRLLLAFVLAALTPLAFGQAANASTAATRRESPPARIARALARAERRPAAGRDEHDSRDGRSVMQRELVTLRNAMRPSERFEFPPREHLT